jgi:hypothetical protein
MVTYLFPYLEVVRQLKLRRMRSDGHVGNVVKSEVKHVSCWYFVSVFRHVGVL